MINRNPLTIKNLNQEVTLNGWVSKSRRLGDLIFIDLRNARGITQLVIEQDNPNYEIANTLRSEFVISVLGIVVERKSPNPEMPSGEIEIKVEKLIVLSEAETTPIIIADETDALEPKRLEHRYLDIRREPIQRNLLVRAKVNKIMRNHMDELGFIEVETPTITVPTPGGAGELKVKSAQHEGKSYALAQSPQLYKQLLMYGGLEGYYQIARCYRDEKSRSDRQLEFTQLDIEKSFTSPEQIMEIITNLMSNVAKEVTGQTVSIQFPTMTYKEAMSKYGSDKPDTRFENTLVDLTLDLTDTEVNFISEGIAKGYKVKAVAFEGEVSSNEIKKLEEEVKMQGGSGLAWAQIEGSEIVKGSIKALSKDEVKAITKLVGLKNYIVFMVIDQEQLASELMGRVRIEVAKKLNVIEQDKLNFVWVTNWPMFELNESGNLEAVHHPFTSPTDVNAFMNAKTQEDYLALEANAYDIVLNGAEIGGGSIRIFNEQIQNKVFEVMNISKEEIQEKFGWFLTSMKYGVPQHGGIALGIDRILAILLKQESIRDVIAFPKSTSGLDELTKAPSKDNV